jgi:hypothetical protein
MTKYPTAAIGYLTADDRSIARNLTPLGLQTLVFGSPSEPRPIHDTVNNPMLL